VKIAHPAVIRVLCSIPAVQGLILDAEHGAFSESDLETLCALINLGGKLSIVRSANSDPYMLSRLLDRGARGVMIPRVRTAEEVAEAVRGARYSPAGVRGFDPNVSGSSYGASDETHSPRIMVEIETREALANVNAIASVELVTDLFVGPADLGRGLGSGNDAIFSPVVLQAMETVAKSVTTSSVRFGAYVDSVERAHWAASLGYSLLAIGTDTSFLRQGATTVASAIAPR
jgi:4-hydroxy-2-oxoheptanedioate aldolase